MLYLYESTKLSSVVGCRPPPPSSITDLRSSIAWKTASCVMTPSLNVRRFGAVTPLVVLRVLITFAVLRKVLICSTERSGAAAGAAGTAVCEYERDGQQSEARTKTTMT